MNAAVGQNVRQNAKWAVRALIFLALIFPLYVFPSLIRAMLVGRISWIVGLLVSDVLGSVVVGFLTNNYRLGMFLYLVSTGIEITLIFFGHHFAMALLIGDLIPALIAIYFAQQLFINMGD